jgi:uncharacterized protein DUF5615
MGSLASGLRPVAARLSAAPRVYVDANVPWGAVAFMREVLRWDALFVVEEPDLRRARDRAHFQRAVDLGRTLITLDHDFADPQRFPPGEGPGVVICTAPDEAALKRLLQHLDRTVLRLAPDGELPLRGRTIELTLDVLCPKAPARRRRSRGRQRRKSGPRQP